MNSPKPPNFAMYLLSRFGSPYHGESLAGDLIEQFQNGRPALWVWREVLCAILAAQLRTVGLKPWRSIAKTTLRVINAIMLAAALAFGLGTMTRADSSQNTCLLRAQC
jgi:hypothetical protein